MVCEFLDMFPEELHGLPPQRDIDFGMKLIPGAQPISEVLYRAGSIEFKELKLS